MSDHQLPEDLRLWPTEPYKLLGVPRGVLPRDLKRAYTRLIRVYKPEHFPDHFKRLREAYETLQRYSQWFDRARLETGDESPEGEAPTAESVPGVVQLPGPATAHNSDGTSPAPRRIVARRRLRSVDEELDEAWQWYCGTESARAYTALRELHLRHPRRQNICLRLYWLLSLSPELDDAGAPCDWLTTGLAAAGLSGPLRELYGRELNADPEEAISDRCARLLDVPASAGAIADFVELRWRAAIKLPDGPATVSADLERLRERMRGDDENIWARLVLLSIDLLSWIRERDAVQALGHWRYEIDEMRHLHLKLADALDRLDLLTEMSKGWRSLCDDGLVPAEFLRLIPLSWNQPLARFRSELMNHLAHVAQRPGNALFAFQLVQRRAPTVLFQFRRLLDWLEQSIEPPSESRSDDELRQVVVRFAQDTPSMNYEKWRANHLLDFCLREAISPSQALAVIADGQVPLRSPLGLFETAADDVPLDCVCQACLLFWA